VSDFMWRYDGDMQRRSVRRANTEFSDADMSYQRGAMSAATSAASSTAPSMR